MSRLHSILALGVAASLTLGGLAIAQTTIPGPTTAQVAPSTPAPSTSLTPALPPTTTPQPPGATAAQTVNPTPMPPGSIAGNAPGMSPGAPAPMTVPPGTVVVPPAVPGGTATPIR